MCWRLLKSRMFLVCLGWLLCACASLQDVGSMDLTAPAGAVPTVTTAQGPISKKAGGTLLASHWKNSYADAKALAVVEEQATGKPLIAGNKVTLLYDGPQTMASMMEAIRSAKNHINLETYIFDQDALGLQFAELLMARQRAGVQVHIIYDGIGTVGTPQSFFDNMRQAGIHLVAFNPINPLKLVAPWSLNHRDHRKILVVDGKIGFTGGVNISATYANSSLFHSKSAGRGSVGWRDTHIRIEGPAVAALQWTFLVTWANQRAPELSDSDFFPALHPVGDKLVRILPSGPDGDQEIYSAYILAINAATKSIHITCAYFVPDAQILDALTKAARRGVDVQIILPGVAESDTVFYAGRSFYGDMLKSGIHIHEMQIAVLHAKTAVIDQLWSTVGSANIDLRSFMHNYEMNAVVIDTAFSQALESAFAEDLRHCVEVTTQQWAQRSLAERLKEWTARRLAYWL